MGTFAPNGGSGTVGQYSFPLTDYVAMSCYWTTVTGAGDTLTINWAALPIQCFEGGCGWNYAIELVGDSAAQWDGGLVGWWRLDSAGGPAQDARPGAKPTEADLERLIEAMAAATSWQRCSTTYELVSIHRNEGHTPCLADPVLKGEMMMFFHW
jgi:hypothetical protein